MVAFRLYGCMKSHVVRISHTHTERDYLIHLYCESGVNQSGRQCFLGHMLLTSRTDGTVKAQLVAPDFVDVTFVPLRCNLNVIIVADLMFVKSLSVWYLSLVE